MGKEHSCIRMRQFQGAHNLISGLKNRLIADRKWIVHIKLIKSSFEQEEKDSIKKISHLQRIAL